MPPEGASDPTDDFPNGLTPDLLVACYLSWVLSRVNHAVEKYYRDAQPKLFLNVAAPMNHIENEALKTRYLQIIQAAWLSVFEEDACPVAQGSDLTKLKPRFRELLERDVPSKEVRTFEVLPETVAPIVSLSLDPRMEPGMYMIVDMGAGTTELSVNSVEEPGADQRVLCYEDQSVRFGGDNITWIEERDPDDPRRKQDLDEFVQSFMKVFRRTWGTGYQKDSRNPVARDKWRDFQVLLTGGGARQKDVEQAIRYALPFGQFPVGKRDYRVSWHSPIDIAYGGGTNGHASGSESLLAVAHGLSIPRQQWPVFFAPRDVETQQAPEVIEQPPAFWYVND